MLRSEITDDSPVPPSRRSSQSSISVRGEEGEQRGGTYRASINITPATPPRPNTYTEQEAEKEEEGEIDGEQAVNEPEVEGAVGGVKVDDLQQLIKQVMMQIWVLSSAMEVMSLLTYCIYEGTHPCFTETFFLSHVAVKSKGKPYRSYVPDSRQRGAGGPTGDLRRASGLCVATPAAAAPEATTPVVLTTAFILQP